MRHALLLLIPMSAFIFTQAMAGVPLDLKKQNLAKQVPISSKDSLSCIQLDEGKYYEQEEDYDNAITAYREALKCTSDTQRREALQGIERSEEKKENIYYKFVNSLKKYADKLLESVPLTLVLIFLIIMLPIMRFILGLIKWGIVRLSPFHKRSLAISDFTGADDDSGKYISRMFRSMINKYIEEFNENVRLKKKISGLIELHEVKPTIRSTELGEAWKIAGDVTFPEIIPLLAKIKSYIWPLDYEISGSISFDSQSGTPEAIIKLSGIGFNDKSYRADLTNNLDSLESASYQIVLILTYRNGGRII